MPRTSGTYGHEAGSSRAKRSRNVETVKEALLPDVHHEFLEWRGCSREAKSRYNSRAFNTRKPIYPELCREFYATYEFDEVCADDKLHSKKIISFRQGLRFIMDDPNITMEEYIRLQEEKALRHGRTFNWQTATYGKVEYYEDEDDCLTTEFPAIGRE
ncbi:hypothetical protein Tco_0227942 [Tanacetum coccineum]